MNRPGPGPQPLRTIPSGMFQNQQAPAARGTPLATGRLQNGKIGSGSQWGFGGPMGGAPGLATAQARTNGGGLSSFAQTIGSSQPHTPLDPSEFPSLSGAPQAQQNTSAQQIWARQNIQAQVQAQAQHSTIQRPQGQNPPQGQAAQPSNQHQQLQTPIHEDGAGATQGQYPSGADDYRFGGQAGVGQLSGSTQPQTGNIEEFPPLGGAGGEAGPDRRTGMIQNAAYGANANTGAFPGLGQTRNGLSSPTDGQQDRSIGTAVGDRSMHAGGAGAGVSRAQYDGLRGAFQDTDRNGLGRGAQGLGNMSLIGSQLPMRSGSIAGQPQRTQQTQWDQSFGSDAVQSPSQQAPQHKRLSEMTEKERFGLPGLLAMIPLESPDHSTLAVGQDLTVLGLDLSRPDGSPLHPTFGSPFVESMSKPVIPPDFTLPAAYTVTNVPELHTKMNSFSTETLLAIFYQYPRDIMQEIAAGELYQRDWRWHKVLQQWMMKDPELPQPIRISQREERGWYLFFDVMNWRRERKEYDLNYDDLDQRHGPALAANPL